ncbi:molybdopterin-guanine dinucleotide biosynthesis protein MobB [Gaopeijia maritima]|uniref:molybdopterin-guanine dinucleotide biosynthesis protein MobB n=1 Tax=Gaopeijia maritima TaxID=3119007 RepID=UPI00324C9331
MNDRALLGVVLAGGESRRFGRPKGEARVGRLTLVERASRTLRPLCAEVRRSGPDDLPDLRPGEGPLAGIESALARAASTGADGVVVLACDLPAVHTATLVRLIERWREAADPRNTVAAPDLPLQPLAAVWGVGMLPAVTAALDRGERSARDAARDLGHFAAIDAERLAGDVGLAAPQLLHNVNTPDDLAPARDLVLPPIVTVVGWKDSGKTTVTTALLRALADRGIRAEAAKHGHGFRFDGEGTDSRRFRSEGRAPRVVLAGPDEMAVFGGWDERGEPGLGGLVRRWLHDAEVVVAEGWKAGPWPAIEVRAPGRSDAPLHRSDAPDAARFLAVVGEGDDGRPGVPRISRDSAAIGSTLADLVERRLLS